MPMIAAALPVISAVAGVAGAGIAAVGAIGAGEAQSANAAYQAQVARNNAEIAKQNAAYTMESGQAQAAAQGMKARAAVGSLVAAQGANNVDVNTGSPADVRVGSKELANLDTKTIISNAARQAYGYQVAATSDTAEAGLLTQESSQAAEGGEISSLGSFLSGISSVGGNYLRYQNSPANPAAAAANPTVATASWGGS